MLIFGILSICLSLDVFVCALEQGASIRNIRFSKALVYGLIFALCSSGMFLLGHGMSTHIFGRPLATLNKYVAIFVFLILGNGMVIYSFKRGKFVERLQEFDTKQIIKLALIGGLDCFFCWRWLLLYESSLFDGVFRLIFNCTCWLYDSFLYWIL